jgi:hypothetical protein
LQNTQHPLPSPPLPLTPPPKKKTDQEGCFNFPPQTFWDAFSTLQSYFPQRKEKKIEMNIEKIN